MTANRTATLTELDSVTIIGMRVCAARNDPGVNGASFVQMLADLVAAAVRDALEANALEEIIGGAPAGRQPVPSAVAARVDSAAPNTTATPSQSPGSESSRKVSAPYSADSRSLSSTDDRVAAPDHSQAQASPPPSTATSPEKGKLTKADREQLRREYLDVCRVNGGSAPYGWVAKKAKEYGVPYKTVSNLLYKARAKELQNGASASALEVPKAPAPSVDSPPVKPPVANGAHANAIAAPPRAPIIAARAQPPPTADARQKLSDADRDALCREYERLRANGGQTPPAWVEKKAEEHGVSRQTIYTALAPSVARLKAAASLRTPSPRADRYKVRRMSGTYGGG